MQDSQEHKPGEYFAWVEDPGTGRRRAIVVCDGEKFTCKETARTYTPDQVIYQEDFVEDLDDDDQDDDGPDDLVITKGMPPELWQEAEREAGR